MCGCMFDLLLVLSWLLSFLNRKNVSSSSCFSGQCSFTFLFSFFYCVLCCNNNSHYSKVFFTLFALFYLIAPCTSCTLYSFILLIFYPNSISISSLDTTCIYLFYIPFPSSLELFAPYAVLIPSSSSCWAFVFVVLCSLIRDAFGDTKCFCSTSTGANSYCYVIWALSSLF